MENSSSITPSQARQFVRIQLSDGQFWSGPVGSTLEDFFKQASPELVPTQQTSGSRAKNMVIAATVDGTLRELSYALTRDCSVTPVLFGSSDGHRIYRRALSMLLIVAASELFPKRRLTIDNSLPFGGFYCTVARGEPFTKAELRQIKQRMRQIVIENSPITRRSVPLSEATDLFKRRDDDDKLRLMESRKKDYLVLYEMRGVQDYFYGYMAPSTGYLQTFDLTHDGRGFILHYPRRDAPGVIQPISALPKLRRVFYESSKWLSLLGVPDIGALNQAVRQGQVNELILVAEALHEAAFAGVAKAISDRKPHVRLVLIAGPSSSGKTTSSKRLAIQLKAHGLKPYPIGLDNYFVDRDKTPLNAQGELDYEHLHAVDLKMFNADLVKVLDGKAVSLPHYNFHTGMQEAGETIQLTRDHIVIIEGIHGLNPELVAEHLNDVTFRVYISCLTQLNIDRYNRIPTTDVRILRRMVRDASTRGYSALDTLTRWRSVREGENRWIFPYQENADVMFNSSLVYELAVLRPLVEPLLLQIESSSPHFVEAKRLLAFLAWVEPLTKHTLIPDNSLLREFIGGSILEDYTPGIANDGHAH